MPKMSELGAKPRATILAVAFVWATMACQAADAPSRNGRVDREARGDTLFVRNRAPMHRDTAVMREVARIGSAQGSEEDLLYEVSAFVELPDGRVAVADGTGLRLFSPTGAFLERIARPGRGPGEVEHIVGLDVTAEGSLLAVDFGNRRVNVYGPGTARGHWPLPPGMPGNGRNSIVATADGAVYVAYNPPLPTNGNPIRYPRPLFVTVGGGGAAGDTIYAEARFANACPTRSARHWRSGFYEDLRAPYFPKVKWAFSGTGVLAIGCPASYALDLIRPDGTVLRISRAWEPVRVSADERESFVEGQTFSRNRSGYFESWAWQGPRPPEQKPAYQRMFFGEDGRLWVWPAQPSVSREVPERFRQQGAPPVVYGVASTGAFDVFSNDGEYLGAVRLPEEVPYRPFPGRGDPFIRGDTLWALRYDSLDGPYVTKYAVQWPNGGSDRANGT